MERPLDKQTVDNICIANGLRNAKELGAASIRQFVSVVKDIEAKMGVEYIRMEIGDWYFIWRDNGYYRFDFVFAGETMEQRQNAIVNESISFS